MADDGAFRFGGLTDSLGFLLRLAQLRSFEDFFDQTAPLDIRPGEMSVLILIAENPGVRQGTLARALMIKRAHMTKMIRAMEGAGLVRRTIPEADKRSVELWLTEAGQARVDDMADHFFGLDARPNGRLTTRETAQLKRLLRLYLEMPTDPSEESGS